MIWLPLDTIDLDSNIYGPNQIQTGIAVAILIAVVLLSWLAVSYLSSRIHDEEEREHARELQTAIYENDRSIMRIAHDDDLYALKPEIESLFTGDFDGRPQTVRQALAEVRRQWLDRKEAARDAVAGDLPALARYLSGDAILYLVFGSLVAFPLSVWGEILTTEPEGPSLPILIGLIGDGVTLGLDALASYPFSELIFAFMIAAVDLTGRALFDNVIPVSIALFATAAIVAIGDRSVEDVVEPRLWGANPRGIVLAFGSIAGVWLVGTITTVFVDGLGSVVRPIPVVGPIVSAPVTAPLVGLVASITLFVLAVTFWLRRRHDRISAVYDELTSTPSITIEPVADLEITPIAVIVYLVSRSLIGAFGVVTSFVLPFYVYRGVSTGRFLTLVEIAAIESSIEVKATVALFAAAVLVLLVLQTRPAWGDLTSAIAYAVDRQGLRVALLARAVPLLVVFLTFAFTWGSGFFGPLRSLAIGIAAGIVFRVGLWLRTKAKLAYYHSDPEPEKPGRIFVEATVAEDARGRDIYLAWLNGFPIAGRRLDEIVDQIIRDCRAIFADFTPEPSIHRFYFDRLTDGVVDESRVKREYLGSIDKAIDRELDRVDGRTDEDRLDDRLTDDFQDDLYERVKTRKRRKADPDIVVRDGVVIRNSNGDRFGRT